MIFFAKCFIDLSRMSVNKAAYWRIWVKKKYKDLYADCGKGLFLNAQGIFPNELRILVKVEVKWTTKMCNLFCNLAVKRVDYWCCAFYHPWSKPVLHKSGFCRLQKVESTSTFCNETCTRCAFYRPMANLFCSKSRNSVYGVTLVKSWSQYSPNMQHLDRFEHGCWNRQLRYSTRFAAMLQNKLHVFCCSLPYLEMLAQRRFHV